MRWPARRRATSRTPSPPTPRRSAWSPTSSSPPTSRSRRSSRPASTARNLVKVRGNYDDVNRLCTELSGERDWAFVNVNLRPYYAEGSKTIAYEIAEQLGWKTPDRIVAPIASGSLYTKIGKGFERVARAGDHQRRRAGHARRAGRRLLAGGQGLRRRARTSAARSSRTRSPSRWRSGTRPTVPTRSSWHARPAARSRPSPTTRSAPASACWPRRRASSPRPQAA